MISDDLNRIFTIRGILRIAFDRVVARAKATVRRKRASAPIHDSARAAEVAPRTDAVAEST